MDGSEAVVTMLDRCVAWLGKAIFALAGGVVGAVMGKEGEKVAKGLAELGGLLGHLAVLPLEGLRRVLRLVGEVGVWAESLVYVRLDAAWTLAAAAMEASEGAEAARARALEAAEEVRQALRRAREFGLRLESAGRERVRAAWSWGIAAVQAMGGREAAVLQEIPVQLALPVEDGELEKVWTQGGGAG